MAAAAEFRHLSERRRGHAVAYMRDKGTTNCPFLFSDYFLKNLRIFLQVIVAQICVPLQ